MGNSHADHHGEWEPSERAWLCGGPRDGEEAEARPGHDLAVVDRGVYTYRRTDWILPDGRGVFLLDDKAARAQISPGESVMLDELEVPGCMFIIQNLSCVIIEIRCIMVVDGVLLARADRRQGRGVPKDDPHRAAKSLSGDFLREIIRDLWAAKKPARDIWAESNRLMDLATDACVGIESGISEDESEEMIRRSGELYRESLEIPGDIMARIMAGRRRTYVPVN